MRRVVNIAILKSSLLQTDESPLDNIIDLIKKIQSDAKIGTAYERYQIEYMWDLGEGLSKFCETLPRDKECCAEVHQMLIRNGIKTTPAILKHAEEVRRVWSTRSEYLVWAKRIGSYRKLRAVLPLFDQEYVKDSRIPPKEIEKILDNLENLQYEEIAEKRKILQGKYNPLWVSVDYGELYDTILELNHQLGRILDSPENNGMIIELRKKYPKDRIRNFRKLLAAIKNDELYNKFSKKLSKAKFPEFDENAKDVDELFSIAVKELTQFVSSSLKSRKRLVDRIGGITFLGELGTKLNAITSDEELERYRRGNIILSKLISG